jgi:signal transduction histidine kinase
LENGRILLEIIDTGVGIKAEMKEKIFEPFFSTRSGGSGLGLPTAKRIIDAHDGKLTVESTPGHGTAFTINLPAVAAP